MSTESTSSVDIVNALNTNSPHMDIIRAQIADLDVEEIPSREHTKRTTDGIRQSLVHVSHTADEIAAFKLVCREVWALRDRSLVCFNKDEMAKLMVQVKEEIETVRPSMMVCPS